MGDDCSRQDLLGVPRAAGHAVVAWLTFGLLEFLCLSVLPAWRESSLLLLPTTRVFDLGGLLAGYALVGLVIGAVCGAAVHRFARRPSAGGASAESLLADLAALSIVGAWTAHLLAARETSRSAYLGLAVAALLAVVFALRFQRPESRLASVTSPMTTPAAVSMCLLAPLVFRDQLHLSALAARVGGEAAPALKAWVAAGGTLLLIAALLASGAGLRLPRRSAGGAKAGATRTAPPRTGWRSRLATALSLALIVVAAGRVLDGAALRRLAGDERAPGEVAPASRLWGVAQASRPSGVAQASRLWGVARASRPSGVAQASRLWGGEASGVLLITLDAVRADHLSVYGYSQPTSPTLASLADHATVYLAARAASDMSLGTHASLFTGRYPSAHGAWVGEGFPLGRPLPSSVTTLAERLHEAGWACMASVSNGYFLNRAYGLSRGFHLFDVPTGDRLELRSRLRRLASLLSLGRVVVHRPAGDVNAVLTAGMEAASAGGRRFLAFGNYMEAHAPYSPSASFLGRFPGYDASLPAAPGSFVSPEGARKVVDAHERTHLVSLYDASIATLDHELGALFARMRALGVYDGTLIVVTADHGEMLGERGIFGHGAGLVDEVLHVPLIVKYPFQREGRRVAVPVSQVDVVPTVLDVLSLPPETTLDGVSLKAASPGRVIFAEAPPFRVSFDGRSSSVERLKKGFATPPVDPGTLERLKSLGYVR